jgi:CBS domain-containing protein
MARTVQEIMNRELLSVRPDMPISEVRGLLSSFGVGAAPVLDESRRPLGVVSVRGVLEGEGTARQRMSSPAMCVGAATSVDEAARRLARTEMHHMVVVDGTGTAVGMLSTLDLLRAVLGMPVHHPDAFPHWDEATGASWTDDWALDEENLGRAPDGPGVLALVRGNAGERDEVVWVEACGHARARVLELCELPTQQEPVLARVLALRDLRFRAASLHDEAARARVVALFRDRLDHLPPPGAT